MLSNYSIIMLKKDKYNPRQLPDNDSNPRLLVIRVISSANQYIVRYPNGYTDRVNEDWLRGNGMYEPDHASYATIAATMPAVEQEFRRNEPFQKFLENKLPKLYSQVSQAIEAKNHMKQEQQAAHSKPFTIADIMPHAMPAVQEEAPTVSPATNQQDLTIKLLTSIDNKLSTLIELWGGNK